MRCRRLIAPALLGIALSLISGCTDSTSPAAKAWERSAAYTRKAPPAYPSRSLAASDGLGKSIFTPDTALDTTHGRSTFASVPEE